MPTERLYYQDPFLDTFTARITDRRGVRVTLDRTAFYPEGGGQPSDRGDLNGIAVVDVQSDDSGEIWHIMESELAEDVDKVSGRIDAARRLDHMQQHHAQHLLSAVFADRWGYRTLSFHLGADSSTIDLDTTAISRAELEAAQRAVNAIVWRNLPIHARFVDRDELTAIPLRKPPTVTGPVRVVSVEGFDHSACGGTHPLATGTVGMIQLRGTERRGAATRVEFVAGVRALRDLESSRGALARIALAGNIGIGEVEETVGRWREELLAARKELAAANDSLRAFEAEGLLADWPEERGLKAVAMVFPNRPQQDVRALALELGRRGGLALFASVLGSQSTLIFVAPFDRTDFNCVELLTKTLAHFGGKGGGQRNLAQGSLRDYLSAGDAVRWAARRVAESTT